MGHSNIRIKAHRRKVAILRARSKQFDKKNHERKFGKAELVDFEYNKGSEPIKVTKFRDKLYAQEGFGTIFLHKSDGGTFEVRQHGRYLRISDKPDNLGMRFHMQDHSWEPIDGKQPKSLRKRKRGLKPVFEKITGGKLLYVKSEKYDHKSEYPDYTPKKMNQVEYWEKLVQHKLAKWERKNPCPIKEDGMQQDMFENEYLIPWKQMRETATERIRDFVISIYDKLPLTGRFKIDDHKFEEKIVANIKDIDGEGHRVNNLKPETSKLLKTAQKITNKVHKKSNNLVCTNLRDHKRKTGRIILPKAA